MSVRIITDSTVDLPESYKKQALIVPLTIHFGEEEYLDGVTMSKTKFYEKLVESSVLPTTSQATPAAFESVYEEITRNGDSAVVITISAKLSGTYQSACIAAEDYPNIFVVDSQSAAVGSGILAEFAMECAADGMPADLLAKLLEVKREDICVIALLDTLEYLKKGGRISKTAAFAGSILNIKPVVTIQDGEVALIGKARGSKQGNNLLVEELKYFTGCTIQPIRALVSAGLLTMEQEPVYRHEIHWNGEITPIPRLNAAQQAAYDGLAALYAQDAPSCAVLLGVTGSGKTTVYLHLIQKALAEGKGAILLVPEIALTPQMIETFSSHFGKNIAVLHSSLSVAERYDEWKRVKEGKARVVIGTRSAVFAPVENLGIIILDEEQEDTYKSENAPRYHAREIAKFLCVHSNALLLLGSATPCLETRYAAETGRYHLFELPGRYNAKALPSVHIVDMKQELRQGNGSEISTLLRQELEVNLERGEQSILFLNRRGSSKLIACGECGFTYRCPNCSANLTYHSANGKLMCHYCGYVQRVDETCPECGGILKYIGAGTQKIQEELETLFPGVPILRMDTDTVAPAGNHEALLSRFREEKIPIMIGTQMVAKGLDFENVTLVGVVSADQSLYTGNYRAGERTFSLITQVVGRCGRGEKTGRAVIQTFTPENETIRQAAKQDYAAFYESELALRQLEYAPPFTDMTAITAAGANEATVLRCAAAIRKELAERLRTEPGAVVIGPAPYQVVRVNNRFRYRVTVMCRESKRLRLAISEVLCRYNTEKEFKGVSVFADANPLD